MEPEQLWETLGGTGSRPSLIGCYQGPLLILGGGRTVWDDFAKVRPWKGEIMCINDVGSILHDPVRHWVSLHPDYFPGWIHYRMKHCFGSGDRPKTHSNKVREGVDVAWNFANIGGTSGLFACFVGLILGYDEIVLAGVTMTNDGHYFDPPWYTTDFSDRPNEIVWLQACDNYFDGKVKSLSGKTREWLGAPS